MTNIFSWGVVILSASFIFSQQHKQGEVTIKKIIPVITAILGILLIVVGIISKVCKSNSFSIIGGADGPTSIIIAGNLGNDLSPIAFVSGIFLAITGVIIFIISKKK